MKLVFLRHGQTDWNKLKKLMGRTDIELNTEGWAQAEEAAKSLEPDFELLVSSPLKRASQTAKVVSERFQKPIVLDARLSERDFGSLAGLSWGEIQAKTGVDMRSVTKEEKYDFRPYGGESAEDVKARLLSFVEELKSKPYTKAVIVCHSGIISMMRHLFPHQEDAHITNASVNFFEI